MYCSKCGKENSNQARYCAGCGAPLMQPKAQAGQQAAGAQQAQASVGAGQTSQRQGGISRAGSRQSGFQQARPYVQAAGGHGVGAGQISLVVTIIGAIMLLIADLLPLITLSGWGMETSYTYFNLSALLKSLDQPGGTGILFKVIGILWIVLAAAIAYLKVRGRRVPGIAASVAAVALMIFVRIVLGSTTESVFGISIAAGSSLILSTIGAIVAVAGSILQI